MKLSELIKIAGLGTIPPRRNDPEITGVQSDSRLVTPGTLFVAVKGTTVDGHDYARQAIAQGAAAIVGEHATKAAARAVTHITVTDSAAALGRIASAWYGEPSRRITLVGVTGTNGKTTVATLLYDLFRTLGYRTGLLSTVCNRIDDQTVPASHTTPDALTINRLMAQMADAGCRYAFMEVSSHAIDQKRISGLAFDGGIFTNLTRDHLDYHITVENYLKAKKRFFDSLPPSAFALTNADDKSGDVMLQNTPARRLTCSLRTLADFKGRVTELSPEGMGMYINGRKLHTHLTGRFNAANLLAVYGAAIALDQESDSVLLAMSTLRPVPGRFETFHSSSGFTAIVDYAHTPDALANVLNGIREMYRFNCRVITVIGAGGNRDRGKRPLMTRAAIRRSTLLILTSDNPRFEDPADIIRDMMSGLAEYQKKQTQCVTDRREAIKTAVALARKGDVVLVAGKGHENYQEIKGVKHPFDDREVIREILKTDN
jgi:UDP-N-acetylmuramoyl-L-alanyl-D-glutamate--2,6-diaminopimelate ligase